MVHKMEDREETEKLASTSSSSSSRKPRQWLYDRSNGKSKIDPDQRPPIALCWPPPCVKMVPDILEQNACCETYGGIGLIGDENDDSGNNSSAHKKARTWIMNLGMVVHTVGLILSILACLSISSNENLLQAFSFTSGTVTGVVRAMNSTMEDNNNDDAVPVDITIRTGLRHIYLNDNFFGERVIAMDEMCLDYDDDESRIGVPFVALSKCSQCADVSTSNVATLILAVITYIPTMASNVNRMYHNYDVNCQKVFGSVVAFFSGAMSVCTWIGYANGCFASFHSGDMLVPIFVPGAGQGQQERMADVNFSWNPGWGLIFIQIASLIKIIDIVGHVLLKTPTITRNRQEQLDYERQYKDTNE